MVEAISVIVATIFLISINAVISAFICKCAWILWRGLTRTGKQAPDIEFGEFLHFFWFWGWVWVLLFLLVSGIMAVWQI